MKRSLAAGTVVFFLVVIVAGSPARGYVVERTVPRAGGCPQPNHQAVSSGAPINRRWSTSLPGPQALLTVASAGSAQQLDEVEAVIREAYGAWTGVSGTTLDPGVNPGALAPLGRTSEQNACSNDQGTNIDGLNTICFNQLSAAFATGVLAFTRTVVADAAGETVGSSPPSSFAGQILDSDTLFRNDGQATFATPQALATPQGQGAYDLESLLAHELGHFFGLDHSGVWRAMMFPFAPPPGTFLGDRPSSQNPDAPLADDDRVGLRSLYPDPNDTVNVGVLSGRILPANPFSLATLPPPSVGEEVTGIFGAQVVAVDADTGAVVAATFGGWSCDAADPPTRFDGSYRIERLPINRNYKIYAEPLDGLASAGSFLDAARGLCRSDVARPCTAPPVNTNFNARVRPSVP